MSSDQEVLDALNQDPVEEAYELPDPNEIPREPTDYEIRILAGVQKLSHVYEGYRDRKLADGTVIPDPRRKATAKRRARNKIGRATRKAQRGTPRIHR